MPAAIIFDMDGVLCDSEPLINEAAITMLAETYGIKAQPEEFIPFVGMGEDLYVGGVAEAHGVTLTLPRDKTRVYEIYLDIIKGRLQPVAGVHAFVAACRRKGLKLAVATSADRMKMNGNLAEIALPASSFDACVTGDDVTRKKPHPDIFERAADCLGLAPADTLVIEDAPQGVQAAKTAGALCLALSTSFSAERLREAGADWVAADFTLLPSGIV